jgi:tetratricopeptide (TPR) repeat protein
MAKSRPSGPSKGRRQLPKTSLNSLQVPRRKHRQQQTALSASALLTQATNLLHEGQADTALPLVRRALELFQSQSSQPEASLPALTLLGEIYLELGDPSSAALTFAQAVKIDPDGTVPEDQGGGPEKFFWLAQLCEEGGEESIEWFKRGVNILEREIASLERSVEDGAKQHPKLEQMRKKLAAALCGMVEVWMTDLSYVISLLKKLLSIY